MTWGLPLGLAALILLASVQCWRPAGRWPTRLREEALLAGAWLGVLALATVCWPLAGLLALSLWRERDAFDPAVRVWAIAGLLWVAVSLVPPETRWLIPAAYVAAALGQCGLLAWQGAKHWGHGYTYHELGNALHGSMGTRFFCGLLLAQALPLAPVWAMPILAGGLIATSSATALLAATAGMLVAYPAAMGWVVGSAVPVAFGVVALRNGLQSFSDWRQTGCHGFSDGLGERGVLWCLTWARWTRLAWPDRLIGRGHDAFSTHGRWWAHGPLTRVHLHACNDGLQSLLEVGLVGLGLLLTLVGLAVVGHGHLGDPLTGTLVAILVGSLIQFPLHVAHMAVPSLILLALLGTRG